MKITLITLAGVVILIALIYALSSDTEKMMENDLMQDNTAESREVNPDVSAGVDEETKAVDGDILEAENNETSMTNEIKKDDTKTLKDDSTTTPVEVSMKVDWRNYVKPSKEELKKTMDLAAFKVTQEDGTERAGTSPYDKLWDKGIYVDILSGEPLYSSKDKFDSGTGWPSFVAPISKTALTEHEDRKLFSTRTETRSAIADNHIGHVFNDGPRDRGGLRYCMNGVALKFIAESEMEKLGYGEWLTSL